MAFAYDAAGRRTSLTLPNGIITEYAYDAASRLTGLTYKQGATVLGTLTYTYDASGNRTQVGGTWARTGLPQAVPSATYDAANQQVTFGGQTLTYDANGNLTSDGTNTYTWNARNQLVAINGASLTATFQHDSLGRRRTKTINSTGTDFLYDGLNPVQELSGGSVVANLVTGLGIDEFFTRTDSAGTRALLTDALGSSVALADNAGTIQTEYTYEPFGRTTATGPTSTNPFQYTGRENDGTGLYYYRARYYSPAAGRFITEDPIASPAFSTCPGPRDILLPLSPNPAVQSPDLRNLYAYVKNSPTALIDPSGLGSCEDELFTCLARASENARECLRNVVTVTAACVVGCVPLCAAAGPAFAICLPACEAACARGSIAATGFCQGLYRGEQVICGANYYGCKRPKER